MKWPIYCIRTPNYVFKKNNCVWTYKLCLQCTFYYDIPRCIINYFTKPQYNRVNIFYIYTILENDYDFFMSKVPWKPFSVNYKVWDCNEGYYLYNYLFDHNCINNNPQLSLNFPHTMCHWNFHPASFLKDNEIYSNVILNQQKVRKTVFSILLQINRMYLFLIF